LKCRLIGEWPLYDYAAKRFQTHGGGQKECERNGQQGSDDYIYEAIGQMASNETVRIPQTIIFEPC
jgi:hypothetical protein